MIARRSPATHTAHTAGLAALTALATATGLAALTALAACGGESGATADAGSDPDAPAAVAPGPLAVTVLDDSNGPATGEPLAGARVVAIAPDGGETVVLTDALGRADLTIGAGTTVYVVRALEDGSLLHVDAYTDVEPGTVLVAGGAGAPSSSTPLLGFASVTVDADPRADRVGLGLPCRQFQTEPPPTLSVPLPRCAASDHATLVGLAFRGDGLLGWGSVEDVDLFTLVNGDFAVTALRPPVTAHLAYTAVPFELTGIASDLLLEGETTLTFSRSLTAVTGPALVSELAVAPIAETTQLRTILTTAATAVTPVWNLRRRPGLVLSHQLDLGAASIPFMTTPAFDAETGSFAWTYFGGNGHRPDVVTLRAFYTTDFFTVVLVVHTPGRRDHLTLPFSPALAEVAPRRGGSGSLNSYHAVDLVGADYREALRRISPEERRGLDRPDAFRAYDDVWITGRDLFF